MSKWLLRGMVFGLGLCCCVPSASAGIDDASDAAYGGGWLTGTNGGTGFGAWTLTASGGAANSGFFRASSNFNGSNGAPGIDAGGFAWGTYANSGQNTTATRPFSSPLSVGDAFGIQIDNGNIDSGSSVGFRLSDATATTRFSFQFIGGAANYTVTDAGGTTTTTLPFTDGGLNIAVDLTSPTSYLVTATRIANGVSYQQTGNLIAGTAIDRFIGFNLNAGGGGSNDAFFNRIQVNPVPEPATVLLICGIAGSAVAGVRRRRKVA